MIKHGATSGSGATWSSCLSHQLPQHKTQIGLKKTAQPFSAASSSSQVTPHLPMDRFVEKTDLRSQTALMAQPQIEAMFSALPDHAADAPDMKVSGCSASPSSHHRDNNTELIAQAVAALLTPIIATPVEKTVNVGMQHIKKQLEHIIRLNEAENRLSNMEEELYQAQVIE